MMQKAEQSGFYRWLLNTVLLRTVPFNKPHNLRITAISGTAITIRARNRRANQNHLKGIHACLLATLCEYASGLGLLVHLSPKNYRIILKNIHMTYHYQAKTDVQVTFDLKKEEVQKHFIEPLRTQDALFHEFTVDIHDTAGNHICTGLINWQVKAWDKVRTK